MSPAVTGALLGAATAVGTLLVLGHAVSRRRPRLAHRVLPYLRDLPQVSGGPLPLPAVAPPWTARTLLRPLAVRLDRLLGGTTSVRRRLERAQLPMTVQDLRVEQVLWGLTALAATAAPGLWWSLQGPGRAAPVLVACAAAFLLGVLLRENRLSAQVTEHERQVLAEFPAVAELLALAVAAGEGPVAALDRVVRRSRGALALDLGRVLAEVRTGTPVSLALDRLAARTGVPVLARFAEATAVALERGTPLADVLHAQAADVREAGRRALVESGARREVLMMVPVVFLVLPVTVLFAFWPGLVGLRLVTP